MTHRERMLAAIRHEVSDRIPVDAICIENQPQIAALLGIPEEQVLAALGIDGRGIGVGYAGNLPDPPLNVEWLDEWGTSAAQTYGAGQHYPLANARTVAEVERHGWPDPSRYNYAASAQACAAACPDYATRGPYWQPLFCRVCSLFGMEDAMVRMMTEPAVFEAALDRVFDVTHEVARRYVAACGDSLDILCYGDDFATQRDLMIDPVLWRRFLKPRLARIFEVGKGAGKHVWFHSCGNISSVLPDLVDIGMDVWETVQLHTLPMTPAELKREYGRHLTFFGGINTQQLPYARPHEVRAEVERVCTTLGQDGGFICGPDHHIKPDVPPENAVALFEAARSFRRTGRTG